MSVYSTAYSFLSMDTENLGRSAPARPAPTRISATREVATSQIPLERWYDATISREAGAVIIPCGRVEYEVKPSIFSLPNFDAQMGDGNILYGMISVAWFHGAFAGPQVRPTPPTAWGALIFRPQMSGWPNQNAAKEEIHRVLLLMINNIQTCGQQFPLGDFILNVLKSFRDQYEHWTRFAAGKVQQFQRQFSLLLRAGRIFDLPSKCRPMFHSREMGFAFERQQIRNCLVSLDFWKRCFDNHTKLVTEVHSVLGSEEGDDAINLLMLQDEVAQALQIGHADQDAVFVRALAVGYVTDVTRRGENDVETIRNSATAMATRVLDESRADKARVVELETANTAATARIADFVTEVAQLRARIVELEAQPPVQVTRLGVFDWVLQKYSGVKNTLGSFLSKFWS